MKLYVLYNYNFAAVASFWIYEKKNEILYDILIFEQI